MADVDEDWQLSDEEQEDGPQHDPGHGALVVAQSPAEVPASSSSLQVRATPIAPRGTIELGGQESTVVWSVYKNVIASVFSEVRQLVEQEGLEPSVATDIRDVRLASMRTPSTHPD